MESKFCDKDDFGILDDKIYPYIGIKITKEQENYLYIKPDVDWYECNGQKLFEIKDKDGKSTGEFMAFLLFVR